MNENQPTAVEEAKELEVILGLVNEYYNGASDLASNLCDFNDRTQGCSPNKGGATPETPPREGLIGNIFDRLDSLDAALNRASAEFRRLSRVG